MNVALVKISGSGPTSQIKTANLSVALSDGTPIHYASTANAAQVTKSSTLETAIALVSGPLRQISGWVNHL